MKSWFITYKRPLIPPGTISLIVTQSQGCLLTVTGPMLGVDLPDKHEIGKYQRACNAQEVQPLRDLAVAAMSAAAASRDTAVSRGTRFLAFGMGETGGALDNLASYPLTMPFPAAIRQFDEAMIAVARKLLDKPTITLKGSASFPASVIAPKQVLEIAIVLRNSGTMPVLIHNPATAEDDDQVGVEIVLEKNLPPDDLEDDDRQFVRLKKGEVTQLRALGMGPASKIQPQAPLGPGQELILSAKIQRHVFMAAGSYRARVIYTSLTEGIPEDKAVQGSLSIPAGSFTIQGKK